MSDDSDTNSVLAIIPAYNEGRHIGEVVRQTLKHLPVLVIDDGSTDPTAAEAEQAGAEVARQIPNQGKGVALMRGFREAIKKGYSAVVMLDADGQHDPDEIPAFLEAYHAGGDLVIGKRDFRYMPQPRRTTNRIGTWMFSWAVGQHIPDNQSGYRLLPRRTTNRIGTWMFSWAVGQHIPDNQSGYRLLSRRMMEATLESKETNFEFEVEMIVVCIQRGYHLAWVPIRTIYGDERSHIRPLRHVYHFSRVVLQARQAIRRAKKINQ